MTATLASAALYTTTICRTCALTVSTAGTGTCTASFDSGTTVTLTASTGGGGTFIQWLGDACAGSASLMCPVPLTGTKSVTAVYRRIFTDSPLSSRVTPIKAVHFTELGAAINSLRATAGLDPFAWTAGTPVPRGVVKAACLTDLRRALTQAYTAAGRAASSYTDPTVTARTTPIKASHLNELRTFVRNLE